MLLSPTLDYAITMLTHIMAFPADRPGMLLFVLILLFQESLWNAELHNMQDEILDFAITKVFICWVCSANSSG